MNINSNGSEHGSTTTFSIISSLRYDPDLLRSINLFPHAGDTTISNKYNNNNIHENKKGLLYSQPFASPYYLLRYHHFRLLKAATEFQWPKAVSFLSRQSLDEFERTLDSFIPDPNSPWRLRILIDIDGQCAVDAHPAAKLPLGLRGMLLPAKFEGNIEMSTDLGHNEKDEEEIERENKNSFVPWKLVLDKQRTKPSQFTTHKTTARGHYDAARRRVGIESFTEPREVLLVNMDGEIMEGSITTVYFRRRRRGSDGSEEGGGEDSIWITPSLESGGMIGVSRQYALDSGICEERVIRVEDLLDGEECLLSNGVRGFIPAVLDLGCGEVSKDE